MWYIFIGLDWNEWMNEELFTLNGFGYLQCKESLIYLEF